MPILKAERALKLEISAREPTRRTSISIETGMTTGKRYVEVKKENAHVGEGGIKYFKMNWKKWLRVINTNSGSF